MNFYDFINPIINDILNESKRTTISRVTRKAKINRAIGSLSASLAKKTNDPLYKRMIFYKEKYVEAKRRLVAKYANRVKSQARK